MKEDKKNQGQLNFSKNKPAIILGVLAAILAITNLWTFFVYAPEKMNSSAKSTTSKYSFLDPARGIYDKKDLIVNIQPLRESLEEIGKDKNISIYFEYLNTGANIAINKDANFFPASLLKLPLAMTAVKKIERGEWKWESRLVIMPADKDERFGELYKKTIGSTFTIEELVSEMLVNSDNTAYLMILRNLEPDEFAKTQSSLSLRDFFSKDGKISAKNYAVILRALYEASYLTPENSEKLLRMMSESKYDYLNSGLPDGVVFSHKIGVSREENAHLDAGIVYVPARPYFLVVMINTSDKGAAQKKMKEISARVYDYVVNYKEGN